MGWTAAPTRDLMSLSRERLPQPRGFMKINLHVALGGLSDRHEVVLVVDDDIWTPDTAEWTRLDPTSAGQYDHEFELADNVSFAVYLEGRAGAGWTVDFEIDGRPSDRPQKGAFDSSGAFHTGFFTPKSSAPTAKPPAKEET